MVPGAVGATLEAVKEQGKNQQATVVVLYHASMQVAGRRWAQSPLESKSKGRVGKGIYESVVVSLLLHQYQGSSPLPSPSSESSGSQVEHIKQ